MNTNIFAYPNPSTGQFQIRYGNTVRDNVEVPRTIVIYDGKGSKVYEHGYGVNSPFEAMNVDLTGISKGSYIINLLSGTGKVLKSTKVVIQ